MTEGFDRLHPAVQYHVRNTLGWTELRDLQQEAIGPLLDGHSALLLAPTAGGKTEAALLPLLSRMLLEGWDGLSVLYLSPLRALANNLEPRLSALTGMVGRRAELWHGDVGVSTRRNIVKHPPELLLATPEAVEGILAGSRTDHRALFANLQTVIIDELHAFAGEDRGWQLLALLCRLQHIAGRPLQRVGLSATVGNPEALLGWLTAGGRPGVLVSPAAEAESPADVKVDYVGSLENAAQVIAALHRGEKRLVFCDSRARVERLAYLLRERGVDARASHSSLSAEERRVAERAFAESENCVIVATSTLELGIDVGDLDRVIQVDDPGSVAGFLQRLGRTGRRSGARRNCLFLATDPDALLRILGLMHLWRRGWVEPLQPPPLPLHVLVQQIISLAHQQSGVREEDIPDILGGFLQASELGGTRLSAERAHLVDAGWLRRLDGRLWPAERTEERFRGKRFTELLSVFTTPELFTVRHGRMEIGQVHGSSLAGPDEGPTILTLAARSWRVSRVDYARRILYVEPTQSSGKSRWLGGSRPLRSEHGTAIRAVLCGDLPWDLLSRRAKSEAETLLEQFAWVRPDQTAVEVLGNGRCRVWTFAGTIANATLQRTLAGLGTCPVSAPQQLYLDLRCKPEEAVSELKTALSTPLPAPATDDRLPPIKFAEILPDAAEAEVHGARYVDQPTLDRLRGLPIIVVRSNIS